VIVGQFKLPSVFPTCLREVHLLSSGLLSLTYIKTHKILVSIHETNQDSKQQILFRDNFFSDTRYTPLYKKKERSPFFAKDNCMETTGTNFVGFVVIRTNRTDT